MECLDGGSLIIIPHPDPHNVVSAQKNHLSEMVLLSTHNIMMKLMEKKISKCLMRKNSSLSLLMLLKANST